MKQEGYIVFILNKKPDYLKRGNHGEYSSGSASRLIVIFKSMFLFMCL